VSSNHPLLDMFLMVYLLLLYLRCMYMYMLHVGCYSPANFIFTGGMHLMAVLLYFLFNALYLIYETKIQSTYTVRKREMTEEVYISSLKWNRRLWYLGMFSVVLLCVTGSVPVTVSGKK
jgi:predicted membrane protein